MPPQSAAGEPAPTATFSLDPALVRSAMTGNRAAVAGVLRALRPMVFRYCLGRLGTWQDGSSDAEDCCYHCTVGVRHPSLFSSRTE